MASLGQSGAGAARGGLFGAIVGFALRFRGVVLALALLLAGYGVYSLRSARYDVFPEFAAKQIEIQTEAPGLSPEQVEQLVTRPIESAVNGAEGLTSIRSSSVQGLSLVTLIFSDGGDVYRDRQVIAERITGVAASLPAGVGAPRLTPLTSSTGDLMTIGLTSERLSLTELRSVADWEIEPRLLAVDGVAKVGTYGGGIRELRIGVIPSALVRHGLSIGDVLTAARGASGVVGAGFIDTTNQRIVLQTEGQTTTARTLGQIVVRHERQGNVTLSDVAEVTDGAQPPIGAASVMGKPAVVMNVWTQYGANTLETTRRVDAALDELAPLLKKRGVTADPSLFRAASFVEVAVHNIRISLVAGAILVVIVLFLFLGHLRSAAISCIAIPLSLLASVLVLQKLGHTLNTMTLGGLAIAVGEVVDDAVIDVENILRRLRERGPAIPLGDRIRVIYDASLEVRTAVVYATLAVILVFIPILTMSGLAGKLFGPMALAYIFAILASLLTALTVTPALALVFTSASGRPEQPRALILTARERYASLLEGLERRHALVIALVLLLLAGGIALLPLLPTQFLPQFRESHYLAHMELAPGTSIAESERIGRIATARLLELPFVRAVAQRVGRAASDDVFGPQSSEIEIDLKEMSGSDAARAQETIGDTLQAIPGGAFAVNTFLTERIDETISGFTQPIAVNVFGNDLDALDGDARKVAAALGRVSGAADVRLETPPGAPLLSIRLRAEALARWGIEPVRALEAVRTAFEGDVAGQVYEENRVTDITVAIADSSPKSPADVGALPLRAPDGTLVLLREIADIRPMEGRYEIRHAGAKRVQTITCNVRDTTAAEFVARARKSVAALDLAPGAYVEFTGSAEEESRSRGDLLLHSILAVVGIALLLSIAIPRPRNGALVGANVPFALVGGVVALVVTRQPLSIGATVGFVTLFGITLRNSLMMISHFEHLVRHEGETWGLAAAVRGASERVVPIAMTSTVTALGLLPLALSPNSAGREIEGPMAIVILGGLVTSTLLNLLVLPMLALHFGRFGVEEEAP